MISMNDPSNKQDALDDVIYDQHVFFYFCCAYMHNPS